LGKGDMIKFLKNHEMSFVYWDAGFLLTVLSSR